MKHRVFDKLLEVTLKQIMSLLSSKSAEYSKSDDKLYNFKAAAIIDGESPEEALWGMYKKHLVSVKDIKDMAAALEKSNRGEVLTEDEMNLASRALRLTKEKVDEKILDSINYHLLLKARLYERFGWNVDEE